MSKEKAFTWGGVVLLILFIAFRPTSAAQVFKAIGGGIVDVATGFGDFVTSLISDPNDASPCSPNSLMGGDHKKRPRSEATLCSSQPNNRHRSSGTLLPEPPARFQPTTSVPKPKIKKLRRPITINIDRMGVHGEGVIGPVKSIVAEQSQPNQAVPHLTPPYQAVPGHTTPNRTTCQPNAP